MGEIEKIEQKLKGEELNTPKSEIPVNSTAVLDVLWHNASVSQDNPVEYSSKNHVYSVAFGYAEVKMADGNVGVFTEIPGISQRKDVISMTFNVSGLADNRKTELQFFKNNITVTPEREYRHILDFQWAVLNKGNV